MQQGPLRSDNLSCLVTLVESMDQHELCGPFHRLASTSRPFLPVESCESPQGLDRRHEGTMMNRLSVPVILSLAVPATTAALILDQPLKHFTNPATVAVSKRSNGPRQ